MTMNMRATSPKMAEQQGKNPESVSPTSTEPSQPFGPHICKPILRGK